MAGGARASSAAQPGAARGLGTRRPHAHDAHKVGGDDASLLTLLARHPRVLHSRHVLHRAATKGRGGVRGAGGGGGAGAREHAPCCCCCRAQSSCPSAARLGGEEYKLQGILLQSKLQQDLGGDAAVNGVLHTVCGSGARACVCASGLGPRRAPSTRPCTHACVGVGAPPRQPTPQRACGSKQLSPWGSSSSPGTRRTHPSLCAHGGGVGRGGSRGGGERRDGKGSHARANRPGAWRPPTLRHEPWSPLLSTTTPPLLLHTHPHAAHLNGMSVCPPSASTKATVL